MATTQKQIAQRLNLSQSIVAQALNDYPGVATATRLRVRETAREMGYGAHSNSAARALIAKRHGNRPPTQTIAVLMSSFCEGVLLRDVPFYQPLLRGIELEAIERKLDLSFCVACGEHLPHLVVEHGVDGVISLYNHTASVQLMRQNVMIPALSVGDAPDGSWALMPDNFEGARVATRHLIELGHRRIAYLGMPTRNPPMSAHRERLDGYLQALKESGISVADELIDRHAQALSREMGAAALQRLFERTPDVSALVCFNDRMAMGAMQRAGELGLRVPQDLSIVGFDDTSEEYNGAPKLTTIAFDRLQMGRRAVQLLWEFNQKNEPGAEAELLPIELIARDSTCALQPNLK